MSYSRWSNSRWYTYYTALSGDTKETQALEIMIDHARTKVFTYEELTNDIDGCLMEIEHLCSRPVEYRGIQELIIEDFKGEDQLPSDRFIYVDEISPPDPATVQELEELKVYMENFISDVRWEYSFLGKFSDFLIGRKLIGNFGWWLNTKFRPKRKKYEK